MEIKVFAGTNLGHVPTKEEMDRIGGLTAGVCYLKDTIENLFHEDEERTKKREGMIKLNGHKSPFDHPSVNLEINDIPKIVAMILNDEQMYTTSEKSARYKKMTLFGEEKEVYEKWLQIFEEEIKKLQKDGNEVWLTDLKIKKLAQENARYLTPVFTPTNMVYTVSYRQLNVIYLKLKKEIEFLENKKDSFSTRLRKELIEFNNQLEKLGYIDDKLSFDDKNLVLKLFNRSKREIKEQFGESYTLFYHGSLAQLAEAQRHRTLDYTILMGKDNDAIDKIIENPKNENFYLPPILKGTKWEIYWLADCKKMAEKVPQGMMIPIKERGTFENFILKMKERNCTQAQLEIDRQTTISKKKMFERLLNENPALAEELKPYLNGSRCTFKDYSCQSPCNFKPGIKGDRII